MPKVVSRRRKRGPSKFLRHQKWRNKFLEACRKKLLSSPLEVQLISAEQKRSRVRSAINEVLEECGDDMEIDEEDMSSHFPSDDNASSGLSWDETEDELFMKWVEDEMLNELSNIPHLDFIDAEDEELIRMIKLDREQQLTCPVCNEDTIRCENSQVYCLRDAYVLEEHMDDLSPFKEAIAQAHMDHHKICCHGVLQFTIQALDDALYMLSNGRDCRFEKVVYRVRRF